MAEQPSTDPEAFVWEMKSGDTISIPLFVRLDVYIDFMSLIASEATMLELFSKLAPDAVEALRGMDRNDFLAMFAAWEKRYAGGATPGESGGSPA